MDEPRKVKAKELNDSVWATVAPSPIHGVGVFAIRDIKKGTKLNAGGGTGEFINTDMEKVKPEIRKLILQRWPTTKYGQPFLSPNDDILLISFMNHSNKPNYDKFTDTTLCDIIKGTEITEDYGEFKDIIKVK